MTCTCKRQQGSSAYGSGGTIIDSNRCPEHGTRDRDIAVLTDQLRECRARCEHMKTLEGLSIDELNVRLMAAKEQLEFDRTKCAEVVTALDKAMDGRFWLTEGRGSYAWDDDRYRTEFAEAAKEILAAVAPIRGLAINMASRLESTDQVIQARRDLKAENAQLRYAMRQAIKNAGGIAEPGVSDEFLLMGVPAEMGALKYAKDKLEKENAALREFAAGIRELFPEDKSNG